MELSNVLDLPRTARHQDSVCARSSPLSIFSIGRDAERLRRREEAIREHSDLSIRSMSPEEAESWARSAHTRLWIFCASIELSRLVYLACSVRRYSRHSRLVLVTARPVGFEATLFDCVVQPGQGAEALLDAVSRFAVAA